MLSDIRRQWGDVSQNWMGQKPGPVATHGLVWEMGGPDFGFGLKGLLSIC